MMKKYLENLYRKYNKPEFIHPDPLEFLSGYPDLPDREVVALIASSLAYGRVAQILRVVGEVLDSMGKSPREFLEDTSDSAIRKTFSGFRHRFASGENLACLLTGIKRVLDEYGALENCFLAGWKKDSDTILPALQHFVNELVRVGDCGHLLPDPEKGSACKRINLFLRWLVRCDAVDPGGWKGVDRSRLIVPIDTHMHRAGTELGFTSRSQADMKTALEITDGFRTVCPDDPVKYDFALTRPGIRG